MIWILLLISTNSFAEEYRGSRVVVLDRDISVSVEHINKYAEKENCETFKNVDGGWDIVCGDRIDGMVLVSSVTNQ